MVKPLWLVKWLNYEYWPTWLLYLPILPYLLLLALRSRSFAFFTNVNPLWKDGGMIHYNKNLINVLLPQELRPQSMYVEIGRHSIEDFKNISYPVIAKPAAGERGKNVVKIDDREYLIQYVKGCKKDQIIESFIKLPCEAGVFVVRHPSQGILITSVTQKEFMTVIGDGKSSVLELMQLTDRSRFQIHRFTSQILSLVPKIKEKILLEPIGNHNRGTKFINANHEISSQLVAVFKKVLDDIPTFNYGRFDIKYNTWSELLQDKNWLVIEVNGVNSEPTHIYDQTTGLITSVIDLCRHWKIISDISIHQTKNGIKPISPYRFFIHYMG